MRKRLSPFDRGVRVLRWIVVVLFVVGVVNVAGCRSRDETITLQLNWKPEPQFGGFYAADYAEHGLKVSVAPGGVGAPTIQQLGAGRVPFAIVSADEIPKARENGIKAVALFAVYQTHPQGILTKTKRQFATIDDVFTHDGTLAMESGLPYSDFLKDKYGFGKLKVVPSPGGDLSMLRANDDYAMQCFVTSEPLAAKKAGLDVTTFLIADSGYNPYATVLATTDDYLKNNPDTVRKMVAAVTEGWRTYLATPAPTNDRMHALNPTMDLATFIDSAAAQKPLIDTGATQVNGLGTMSVERWRALLDQLRGLKLIGPAVTPEECFRKPEPPASST